MAAFRTREDYDYDLSYASTAERGLTLHDMARDHRGRQHSTETAVAVRRDLSTGVLRRGAVHHTYECRGRDACYVSSRRETDFVPIVDTVRRNHRKIDQMNRQIKPGSNYSQVRVHTHRYAVHCHGILQTDRRLESKIHPKMKSDGTFPIDFGLALTVDQFEAMDMSVLDRILISYGLLCTFTGRSKDIKRRKLWRLFEFLGADNLTPPRESNHAQTAEYGGAPGRYITW
ncbi:hypothetical protein K440DRAFT_670518 [Wilcoxina mikolae CBS 423.85]|nr:hypothetical protein K440DRAFT_670518 [Wilcoxina mikolae CBS 423.85]